MDQIVKSNGDTIQIYAHGTVLFYRPGPSYDSYNGYMHRLRGPARILTNGRVMYYVDNMLHRIDGPAYSNGHDKQYFVNNKPLDLAEFFLKYGAV